MLLKTCSIRRQIFHEVGDRIAGGLEGGGGERHAVCRLWPEAGGVVDVVIGKALFFDLLRGQIPGELMDDGTDHLHMV